MRCTVRSSSCLRQERFLDIRKKYSRRQGGSEERRGGKGGCGTGSSRRGEGLCTEIKNRICAA